MSAPTMTRLALAATAASTTRGTKSFAVYREEKVPEAMTSTPAAMTASSKSPSATLRTIVQSSSTSVIRSKDGVAKRSPLMAESAGPTSCVAAQRSQPLIASMIWAVRSIGLRGPDHAPEDVHEHRGERRERVTDERRADRRFALVHHPRVSGGDDVADAADG